MHMSVSFCISLGSTVDTAGEVASEHRHSGAVETTLSRLVQHVSLGAVAVPDKKVKQPDSVVISELQSTAGPGAAA